MEVVEYFNTSCRVDDKSSNATDDSEITIWFLEIQNAAITLVLISLYIMNTILGIFWNLIVIHAFRANRLPRNILLLHVCIADLLVCVISGPSSLIIIMQPRWRLGWISCKIVYFLQSIPMVTSTLLLMMLSIERYFTIRHSRLFPALNQGERLSNKIMTVISWAIAVAISLPILIVRDVRDCSCIEIWTDPQLKSIYVICYILFLYALPMAVVAKCHFSVGTGIFSTSLFAAMANGDVPLPMPVQAPNQQVIILASVNELNPMFAKNERKLSTNIELANDTRASILRRSEAASSSTKRGFRERFKFIRQTSKRHNFPPINRPLQPPSSTSFKVRRKMAKMLIIMALIFALAWFPYVVARLYLEFAPNPNRYLVNKVLSFFLLIGHFHSVVNPFVYWYLNRQSIPLRFSFKAMLPWNWGNSRRNIFRRIAQYIAGEDDDHYSRSSSTNEAQLGIFHPRFNRPRRYEAEDQV